MSIIAHAQYHFIERPRHSCKCLPSGYCAEIRRGRTVLEAEEAGRSGMILQEDVAYQPLVARGIFRAHPALVGEGDADTTPIERLRAQDLEQSHRRSPARHHQARESSCADCRGETSGNERGKLSRESFD